MWFLLYYWSESSRITACWQGVLRFHPYRKWLDKYYQYPGVCLNQPTKLQRVQRGSRQLTEHDVLSLTQGHQTSLYHLNYHSRTAGAWHRFPSPTRVVSPSQCSRTSNEKPKSCPIQACLHMLCCPYANTSKITAEARFNPGFYL